MFKNGTAVIEIMHESFSPYIPEDEFYELTKDSPFRYYRYYEKSPVVAEKGEKLVYINVKEFNVVLNEAISYAKEFVAWRGDEHNGRDTSFNTIAQVEEIQQRVEWEDPDDYKVKVIFADPAFEEKAAKREDLTVRPKLARPLAEKLAKEAEKMTPLQKGKSLGDLVADQNRAKLGLPPRSVLPGVPAEAKMPVEKPAVKSKPLQR